MEDHELGRAAFESEDAWRLHCLQHSTAHVMAQAVLRLWPTTSFAIGPSITEGFYYDLDLPAPLSEDDLERIEAEMKRIVKDNQSFVREEWGKDTARAWFGERGQQFKLELIEGIADETVTIYRNPPKKEEDPEFLDLCRGPHVMRTGQCKHFKLLKVSGAYWRGDATRPQLQRIYGTVWPSKEQLDSYMFRLEEAKRRDHRRLGKELELFMFHDYAPGAAFWLPRGEWLYNRLAARMRDLLDTEGYDVVRTPLIFDKALWETSGHWDHYQENLFHFHEHPNAVDPAEAGRHMGLKPMNCPCHMLIFGSRKRSYRELPMRIHDQGVLHRNELSGALSGLTRVRQFSQDDAHLFCAEEQVADEVQRLLELVDRVYAAFDLGVKVKLSTRPADKLGDDALWDRAEGALRAAIDARGVEYTVNEGDGAFYGPKIDFDIIDALGRPHQCATIQLDYQLPIRFDLSYVGADNEAHRPVVIHRAVFGSFERFIGILIEHYGGNFPVWLSPEQVRVMTVSEKSAEHGATVLAALKAAGVQATFDDGDQKIGYKIRMAHPKRIPFLAVIGEREAEEGTVSVRARDGEDPGTMTTSDFVEMVAQQARLRF